MEWAEDDTHIKEVKNPRLIETGYQSSQLKLWTLGPDEWLLFLKLPDYASRKKRKQVNVVQLPLPEIDENQLRSFHFSFCASPLPTTKPISNCSRHLREKTHGEGLRVSYL